MSVPAARSALGWWLDAGVDCIVDEAPRDWLRDKERSASAPLAIPPANRLPSATGPAAPLSDPPGQLALFQDWLLSDGSLPFAAPAAPRVCPAGDPASGLMMLTDMPSSGDCASGTLLSGEVGALFERMLGAIGRDRESIYLAALSCLRAPDGRFTQESAQRCAVLARHHIGLAAPKAVLLLGDSCARALLGIPVAQARGRWHEISTHAGPVKALATLRPHFLLEQPSAKALAWADLQMLMGALDE